MARALLVRGMLAGLVAGLLTFVVGSLLGEDQVGHAVSFEAARAAAQGQPEEPEMFSRTVQSTIGMGSAVCLFGVALGGLFALTYAAVQGRVSRLQPRATAGWLAGIGFACVFLVPFLKYPANPPAVGDPATIGHRTALYFLMMAASVGASVLAVGVSRALGPRLGTWNAVLCGVGVFIIVVALTMTVLPTVDEVPPGFPASLLWRFRLASASMQLTLWAALGLLFGWLAERVTGRAQPLWHVSRR